MRAVIYTRVGTTDQNDEMQMRELNEFVERQGWEVSATYRDVMSGAKANRPGLAQLMADARMKRFDVLLCWKLDRFGRSLVDCLNNIQEPGAVRDSVYRRDARTGHGSAQSSIPVSAPRARGRGGVRALTDP